MMAHEESVTSGKWRRTPQHLAEVPAPSPSHRPSTAATPSVSLHLVILLLLFVALFPADSSAFPRRCREARQLRTWRQMDDSFDASSCKYGWETDVCGVRRCTKGPGDLCGGKHQRYGICGEGLMCSNCNRCYGCSLKTFECFEDRTCNYFLRK